MNQRFPAINDDSLAKVYDWLRNELNIVTVNTQTPFLIDTMSKSKLLAYFFNTESKGQLICTIHLTLLQNQQELVRPDELWKVEKEEGNSIMTSFNDSYQGIPIGGYNQLIDALLDGIETRTNTDFFANRNELISLADKVIYTGSIDQFYDYRFGHLQYRTVRFEQEILDTPNYQGNTVVNYTDRETPYTRIIEHKHFETFGEAVYDNPTTIISREYSTEWQAGREPYYPINNSINNALFEKYKELSEQETKFIFGGRLADYKYYDMAPTIEKALNLARRM